MEINKIKQDFDREVFIYMPGFLEPEEVRAVDKKLGELIENCLYRMPAQHVKYED